jgi:ADP-ribose pyrophosphatase YjhB (NUDIX family)
MTVDRDPPYGAAMPGTIKESEPRLGCGAAIVERSQILLVKRRRSPEANHWGLPGGKVEPGERVEDAVIREIGEELGIAIELGRRICTVDHLDDSTGQWWVAQVYSAMIVSGVPEILEPDALAAVAWFTMDALPRPLTAATLRAIGALADG